MEGCCYATPPSCLPTVGIAFGGCAGSQPPIIDLPDLRGRRHLTSTARARVTGSRNVSQSRADPLPCRLGRLERRVEAEAIDRIDQLLHADSARVERDAGLLVSEAHLCPLHSLEPLQGPLDRNRSAASGHAFDSQHDNRGSTQGSVCQQEHQDGGNPGGHAAPHCVTFLSMFFISCPADS